MINDRLTYDKDQIIKISFCFVFFFGLFNVLNINFLFIFFKIKGKLTSKNGLMQ